MCCIFRVPNSSGFWWFNQLTTWFRLRFSNEKFFNNAWNIQCSFNSTEEFNGFKALAYIGWQFFSHFFHFCSFISGTFSFLTVRFSLIHWRAHFQKKKKKEKKHTYSIHLEYFSSWMLNIPAQSSISSDGGGVSFLCGTQTHTYPQ